MCKIVSSSSWCCMFVGQVWYCTTSIAVDCRSHHLATPPPGHYTYLHANTNTHPPPRRFTPDGRHLVCFSNDAADLILFEWVGPTPQRQRGGPQHGGSAAAAAAAAAGGGGGAEGGGDGEEAEAVGQQQEEEEVGFSRCVRFGVVA
jgi:hypothetical protein